MQLRTDLQAVRGFAALIVVLQHASPQLLHAGYLGVDIFFVISGFVITQVVTRDVDAGTFRLRDFYFRRAKRLLPAAYVTFALTAVAALFFLDMREWRDFSLQLAGAFTYTANHVLLAQTGYFSGEAALKPLLHVWSLAVEGQFYLLMPILLLLAPRRAWWVLVLPAVGASLWHYADQTVAAPDAAFYLLPGRVWQLGLGVLGALWFEVPRVGRAARLLFWPALATLLLVPSVPLGLGTWPTAVLACAAAVVIILRAYPSAERTAPVRWLAHVGDFSYSLYLVHWPAFAFLHNVYAGDPSLGKPTFAVLVLATVGSLVGGWLLYRLVEVPVRRSAITYSHGVAVATAAVSTSLVAVSLLMATSSSPVLPRQTDYAALRRDNVGFSAHCDFYKTFSPLSGCRNAEEPEVLVWGDSYAMQLVPAILASRPEVPLVQATKSSCGPYAEMAQYTAGFPRAYALNCLAFNRSVLEYLRTTPTVKTVVLSAAYYAYLNADRTIVDGATGLPVDRAAGLELATERLSATIVSLREAGKRVVLVAPAPRTGFDYTHCIERKARGRTWFGRRLDCRIRRAEYEAAARASFDLLARISREAGVAVVGFDDMLCDRTHCDTERDGVMLYRDEGHLSYAGAEWLGRTSRLADVLLDRAR